jgi:hypothetical protein
MANGAAAAAPWKAKQLEDQLPGFRAKSAREGLDFEEVDKILLEAKNLYTRWPGLEHDEKRKLIENITGPIVIGKDDIAINLCYIP